MGGGTFDVSLLEIEVVLLPFSEFGSFGSWSVYLEKEDICS